MVQGNENVVDADKRRDSVIDDRGCTYDPYKQNSGLSDSALETVRKMMDARKA